MNSWDEDRTNRAKELYFAGQTAAWIASILNSEFNCLPRLSRSAVIGKAARMGWSCPKSGSDKYKRHPTPRRARDDRRSEPKKTPAPVWAPPKIKETAEQRETGDLSRRARALAVVGTVKHENLLSHHCRMPDGRNNGMHCGATAVMNYPYCRSCADICYLGISADRLTEKSVRLETDGGWEPSKTREQELA